MELTTYKTKVWKAGTSSVITLDAKVKEYEGINDGDWVQIMVKKIPKPKEEEE